MYVFGDLFYGEWVISDLQKAHKTRKLAQFKFATKQRNYPIEHYNSQ